MYLPAVSEATARGPVELEGAVGVGNQLAIEGQRLGRSLGAGEVNKAISSIAAAR